MTDIKKFLFDTNDFSNLSSTRDIVTYSEEQLLLAKEQSFAAGKQAGVQEAYQQQGELINRMLRAVAELSGKEDRRELEKARDTVLLTLRVIHKIMPALAMEHSIGEIEKTVLEALAARQAEPHLTITVAPEHLEALTQRMQPLLEEKNLTDKVVLTAEEGVAPTNCKIAWADGGAERLYRHLMAKVEEELYKTIEGLAQKMEATEQPKEKKE